MTFTILKFFIAALVGTSTLVSALPANVEDRAAKATVYTKCSKPKTVAITFDDGPYKYSKSIVDKLAKYGAKATFFVNGNNYECIYSSENETRLKYAYSKGHQIASHTWAHKDLATLSKSQVVSEMKKVDDALVKIIGARPAWVRPPYGSYNNAVREAAAERQQSIAMWDFDSGDSAGASTTSIKNSYKSLVSKNPATILTLNHETYSTTNSALDDVLKTLSNKGYKMVTVAECVGKSPYVSTSAPKARDSTWKC